MQSGSEKRKSKPNTDSCSIHCEMMMPEFSIYVIAAYFSSMGGTSAQSYSNVDASETTRDVDDEVWWAETTTWQKVNSA